MRVVPVLAWKLLRGSGGRGAVITGLSVLAITIATALLLLTVGIALGFNERGERAAWLQPEKAEHAPAAMMAVMTDFVRGEPIAIVDVAAMSNDAPAPPGMESFPTTGEVWISPALATLIDELPEAELGQRFENDQADTHIAGEIGREALAHPDQLMAIFGRDVEYLEEAPTGDHWLQPYFSHPVPVADFAGRQPEWLPSYQALSAFAAMLVIVPLFVLGTAAGRLSASHREQRLSAMRLVGATPGQVLGITVFETVLGGLAGTVLGLGIYAFTLPLTARVSTTGGAWYVSDLWVGWEIAVAALVAVPLIVGIGALLGLRKLVISPLGVARRQQMKGATVWRGVIFIGLVAVYGMWAPTVNTAGGVIFALFFGLLFLGFSLMGPLVVRVLGHLLAFFARTPQTLLAGRRIVDDPHSVWRTVGGITLTGFVAGFLTIIIPLATQAQDESGTSLTMVAEQTQTAEVVPAIEQVIDDQEINATVNAETTDLPRNQPDWITIEISGSESELDTLRTAIANIPDVSRPASSEGESWMDHATLDDIRLAGILVLTVTLAVACISATITGVSSVLDRRQTFSALRLAGTPLKVLDGARLRETLVPFLMLGGGGVGAGIFCALPLAVSAEVTSADRSLAMLLIPVAVAIAGLTLADIASRITLRSATADPTAHRL